MKLKDIIDQKDQSNTNPQDLTEEQVHQFLIDLQKAGSIKNDYWYLIKPEYCFNISIKLFKGDRDITILPYLYIYKLIGSGKFYLFKKLTDNIITVKGKRGYKCYCIGYEIKVLWVVIKKKTINLINLELPCPNSTY